MPKPRGTNGDGVLVDTLYYRFQGLEIDSGKLSVDGVDPDDLIDLEEGESPQVRPGKVVDKIVPVEVRLAKTFNDDEVGADRSTKSIAFRLTCADPKFRVVGTDIELLRRAVWDFLDQQLAVKWSPYFLVKIERAHIYQGIGNGFEFKYDRVERGVAHDGTLLMRRYDRHSRRGFEVSAWPGEFKDQRGKLMACIPATDENEASMAEVNRLIDELRERLASRFRPDTILQTLANLAGLRLLALGSEDEGERALEVQG